MEKLVNYEIQVRPWGPDGEVMQTAYTMGTLLVNVQHATACFAADENGEVLLPPQTPLSIPIHDISPMLALCEVTRHFDTLEAATKFQQRSIELWTLFGGTFNSTPQSVLDGQRRFRDQTATMFADGFDFATLDSLSLVGLPDLAKSYIRSYHCIFETHEAFQPPFMEAFELGVGWKQNVIDVLASVSADPNSVIHTIEMWWWHACSYLAVPALEAFIGG